MDSLATANDTIIQKLAENLLKFRNSMNAFQEKHPPFYSHLKSNHYEELINKLQDQCYSLQHKIENVCTYIILCSWVNTALGKPRKEVDRVCSASEAHEEGGKGVFRICSGRVQNLRRNAIKSSE